MIQYLSILLDAKFNKDEERGATAVEYGLLVALIAAVIIATVVLLGDSISDAFRDTSTAVDNPPAAPAD
ncbi:pilus assembly protein Flp/PilA [Nocardioides thalensis]|uniref:Pilus assembly protein Flp/PilA n=1 Tax=Nocardioides thalensis TaxID=1914755 RepID=A0A853C5J5_9ACTN|nr:Flp family type IVb pilin [Nocardioides thalensis]NYJ01942.1 pilus assembly protein Flp/PilA [Nocardioides thalensis]